MAIKKASAEWRGDLKNGNGDLSTESGVLNKTAYNFVSRFETGTETNPEELVGAALAACFSMALANNLSKEGYKVNSVNTEALVHFEKKEQGFTITKIELNNRGSVDGIDDSGYQKYAEQTKTGCPVSRALTGPMILLRAELVK